MKKLMIFCLLGIGLSLNAQHQVNSFFDERGIARIQTQAYSPQADTIITTEHRAEDVIWSRVVYRVIDMRYKQNYQLYFPTRSDDPNYRSLFKVIVDGIVDGLPVYTKRDDQIAPDFTQPMPRNEVPKIFLTDKPGDDYSKDTTHFNVATSSAMLLHYDSIADTYSFFFYPYEGFVRNQLKYVIQEVIFFDRHYSRLYSKIMAIAPLQSDKIDIAGESTLTAKLLQSLLFWISFDELRPYLQKQFIIPNQNDTKRVTYDEFFQKKLYTSYLLGDGNIYNRLITDYATTPEDVKKEQDRIAAELLNFEQDLWEY